MDWFTIYLLRKHKKSHESVYFVFSNFDLTLFRMQKIFSPVLRSIVFFFIMQGAVNFALMMSQMEGGCPVDFNTITDLFLQVGKNFCMHQY